MTPKVHIHLHVTDLDRSRAFYEVFFGARPVKEKPGYVKFLPDLAPINLALSGGSGSPAAAADHLGIQLESTAIVMAELARIKAAGLPVREQMGVDCCHANQDKFWVQDPDGVKWEIYHLNYDLEEEASAPGAARQAPGATSAIQPAVATTACCAR
jgi:catechol 2,3-dioxygenase-like lactoylglutathione lyase family enzyme